MRLALALLALSHSARALAPLPGYAEAIPDGDFDDLVAQFQGKADGGRLKDRLKEMAASACQAAGFTPEQCAAALAAYKKWREEYDIQYTSLEIFKVAMRVFDGRWAELVENHKMYAAGKITYKLKLTKFADNANEDKLIKLAGLREGIGGRLKAEEQPLRTLARRLSRRLETETNYSHGRRLLQMPAVATANTADWTKWIGAVQQQSPCQSCWAFTTSAMVTGALHLWEATEPDATGGYPKDWLKNRLQSVQMMMDCNAGWDENDPPATSCAVGGSVQKALASISRGGKLKGVALDSAGDDPKPYKARDGTCQDESKQGKKTSLSCKRGDGVADGCWKKTDPPYMCADASELMKVSGPAYIDQIREMAEYAPVGIAISTCSIPSGYTRGVIPFNEDRDECSGGKVDHAVTIVGWGWDGQHSMAYWKIRNSWGASWGEQGHFRVQRAAKNMNIHKKDPCIPLGPGYTSD